MRSDHLQHIIYLVQQDQINNFRILRQSEENGNVELIEITKGDIEQN